MYASIPSKVQATCMDIGVGSKFEANFLESTPLDCSFSMVYNFLALFPHIYGSYMSPKKGLVVLKLLSAWLYTLFADKLRRQWL